MRPRALLGVVLGLVVTPAAWGQVVKPAGPGNGGVHRLEIIEGPTRTVYYFPPGNSPGERQVWRDMERAENELSYVDNLQALRRQYLAGERALEASRQAIQPLLYGRTIDRSYASGYGATYGATPYGYPYSFYGPGTRGAYSMGTETVSQSLAYGIGPEGRLKEEMARVIASQATPAYASAVNHQLSEAVAAMSADGGKPGDIRAVGPDRGPAVRVVTATLKGGDKIEGRLVREDADWLVVRTAAGEERVRMSEVVRLTTKNDGK